MGDDEETYAKHQLGGNLTHTTMLGLTLNKPKGHYIVTPLQPNINLSKLAKVYDLLPLLCPPSFWKVKMIFCDVCKTKALYGTLTVENH